MSKINEPRRQPGQCGFDDVRKNESGSYYCSVCRKVLPHDFYDYVSKALPPSWAKRLNEQCNETTHHSST